MRYESSVTSVSWIPSEAMTGVMKLPMAIGMSHYDDPPPDHLDDLEALRQGDSFRFANELRAWIEVENGTITDAGYSGGGHIGSTTVKLGIGSITIPAVAFGDLQSPPTIKNGASTFTQTAGGRTGAPMPRTVRGRSLVRVAAPTAWTTLSLTIFVDGSSKFEVTGASSFPRHWIYDAERNLAAKSGLIDFSAWSKDADAENTPWGYADSPAVIAKVESALERELSLHIMRDGAKPKIRKLREGEPAWEQGDIGQELVLLLDGVIQVEVDGNAVAEVGPGSVLGERAILEGGTRTATLRALTPVKLASAHADTIDPSALTKLSEGHHREDTAI